MASAAKEKTYRFTFGPWNISTGADPFGPIRQCPTFGGTPQGRSFVASLRDRLAATLDPPQRTSGALRIGTKGELWPSA